MIKVLLVDDHELVRTGIKRILEDAEGITVVGEVGSGEDALRFMRRRRKPDVVLMDVSMPGMGGLEATRKLRRQYPNVKVIVLTIHAHEPYPTRLLEAGAAGYLTKGCAVDEIITAIREVNAGRRYIGMDIARQIALSLLPGGERSPIDRLSQRELQILLMVTQGLNTQEISDKLCLSPKTVCTYRYRLYEKLGANNDVELTHLVMRHGMLEKAD
ncbi:MAG: UvrY/SirA/GacA family response regulator transcription factor [Gammaproteobacteria bacterium]